ncbi:MAG: hypothetical protein KC419_20770 [Anaerolineales bacterium]|nr:hypothetical protein [Anaerolineales bacterium]
MSNHQAGPHNSWHKLLLITVLLLAACSGAGGSSPADTVEKYMAAKATGDADTIQRLLCAEMEASLKREQHAFDSVTGVQIEGAACQRVGNSSTVSCEGNIIALYGTEETVFPLTSYRVVSEDGEWKWCGEAQ